MHLIEIQLENFKSFGRKTILPFEQGFTAITGPNGSGKSNIGDAILFVLGPKSAKSLRAGKLTDLIYNGGKKGKAASYCKVTLVFDNKDRVIPVDDETVHLTRLVKLSPTDKSQYYSYFYVNGRSSNLSEFDNLLAHARISAEGYNLVQQGDITRIVTLSKVDRRRILDGIAGIAQYDLDIEQANKKKGQVDEKLGTINSLVAEITKRIRSLDKDREDAGKYKQLRTEAEELRAKLAFRKKAEVEGEIARSHKTVEETRKEQEALGKKVGAMKQEHIAMSQELEGLDQKIAELQGSEATKISEELDQVKIAYFRAVDQVDKSREALKHLKEERSHLTTELRRLQKEHEEVDQQRAKVAAKLEAFEGQRAGLHRELKELEDLVTGTDGKAFALQRDVQQSQKVLEGKEEERHRALLEADRLQERLDRLTVELSRLDQSAKQHDFEAADLEHELKALHKNEAGVSKVSKDLQGKLAKGRTVLQTLTAEAQKAEERITYLRRDYEALKAEDHATRAAETGYTRAVNAILEARDKGDLRGILGTIAEIGSVDKKYEDALSIAGGSRLQSVVVDTDEIAASCITFLKKHGLGRVTFLPLNKLIGARPSGKALMAVRDKGAVGFATDLVKFDEQYRAAFWYVFGDTIVVSDLGTARKLMGGVRLVTLGGEITEKAGAMIGGSLPQTKVGFGGDGSRKELDRLGKELRKAVEEADKARSELAAVRKEVEGCEAELSGHGATDAGAEARIRDFEFTRKEHLSARDALRKDRDGKAKERDGTERDLEKLRRSAEALGAELVALTKSRDQKRELLAKATPKQLQKRMKELHDSMGSSSESDQALRLESADLEARGKFLVQTVAERQQRMGAIDAGLAEQEELLATSKDASRTYDSQLRSLKDVAAKSSTQWSKSQGRRNQLHEERANLSARIDKAQDQLQVKDELILQQQEKIRALEEQLSHAQGDLEHVGEKDYSRVKLPPLAELTDSLRLLEKQMHSMEPVNMKALEDFEAESHRKAEMDGEIGHLKEQREELEALVGELDGKKTTVLMKVFDEVNSNFRRVFGELSLNGEAELILENPAKPFEGGLEIKARPKDKKVLRLESLSGGEKSLTALAFIFAIQQYQPSPFYLLDEVDMFLDSINAALVARHVRDNSRTAQFVMISLRLATLERAEHLYGVTMQQSGITDVVGELNISQIGEEGKIAKGAGKTVVRARSTASRPRGTDEALEDERIVDLEKAEVAAAVDRS